MTVEAILKQYDFNLDYSKALVQDLSKEQMTSVPSPGFENHPAFTLGHLVSGSAMMAEDLGASFEMQANWQDLFLRKGPGDPRMPEPNKNKYPTKEELLKALEEKHKVVKQLLLGMEEHKLNEKIKWRFSKYMPSLLDLVIFMCVNHEAMHLGQLAAWRRAMNLPSALAKL